MLLQSKPRFTGAALLIIATACCQSAIAQRTGSQCIGTCVPAPPPIRMHQTYGGRIYFSFPNYDIYATQPPRNENIATGGISHGSSVVYRNNEGMRWDGQNYLAHPAYHRELVTQYYYRNRPVDLPTYDYTTAMPVKPAPQPYHRAEGQIVSGPTPVTFVPAPWVVTQPAPKSTYNSGEILPEIYVPGSATGTISPGAATTVARPATPTTAVAGPVSTQSSQADVVQRCGSISKLPRALQPAECTDNGK